MVTSDFRPDVEIWRFSVCAIKKRNITLLIGTTWSLSVAIRQICVSSSIKINCNRPRIAEISPFTRKSGSRNQTPMSDFFTGTA